jgi:hypothetical protein
MMSLGLELVPGWLFIVFALVVSVFMLIMGALMWRHANAARNGGPTGKGGTDAQYGLTERRNHNRVAVDRTWIKQTSEGHGP